MSVEVWDLAIVGAGPAGMSAAVEARRHGLSVCLLDEQAQLGGQIYRAIERPHAEANRVLGVDYSKGAKLAAAFRTSGTDYRSGASVWKASTDGAVFYLHEGRSKSLEARFVVVASGAMERPFPVAGWTRPGVMGAGAAQIMLKTSHAVPSQDVVLAGCGPLLYLLTAQYLRAGARIAALVDTTTRDDYLRAAKHIGGALRGWRDLKKGLGLLADIRKAKVPFFAGAADLAVEGEERAEALSFTHRGKRRRVVASLVLLHQGVVPNIQISQSIRAEHRWNSTQHCFEPVTDRYGRVADTQVYLVGDGRGIVGAAASEVQGALAAQAVASEIGVLANQEQAAAPLWSKLKELTQSRPFLDALYAPKAENRIPQADDVVVCRCENVSAGNIRGYIAAGCQGPNQTKAFGRCGMGPCQGRFCGLTVTQLIAEGRKVSEDEVSYYRIRPPIKPIRLGQF
ncbi:FAD/NAD(P)-binding oxidoreductase [Aquamicrobium sp. LC103]|uniref:NAD(P)/FAD-dependent oxidoreductase n=1 Tax=Aquamicrobium sp. LC103 TaxID=1120658 RepID=UPI00063EBBE1|nr:FAD/NAD(P)-binding oxidoreductase [Aquamicrobium sp. LC103]TKT69431.1 FAD-dependent oxidoreductase [Aquamicrobium sp. LC103]